MAASIRLYGVILTIAIVGFQIGESTFINKVTLTSPEWINYKTLHGKTYPTAAAENVALYYYNYNKQLIASRAQADSQKGLTLALNQFSDMKLVEFNALFPKTTPPSTIVASNPPPVGSTAPPASFSIADNLGITITPENQGTVCNSGWAYATAKAVEILQAVNVVPPPSQQLSAQNLIDCAGGAKACVNQVPYTAFQYLATYGKPIFPQSTYPNRPKDSQIGMCLTPNTGGTTLTRFSALNNADDTAMMRYVAAGFPVVIEFDPTSFEFMHYKAGIFDPPRTAGGSHYMVVTGYGTDLTTNTNYWLVQNSFGTEWGEMGTIRILRNALKPLAKSALFPIELGP